MGKDYTPGKVAKKRALVWRVKLDPGKSVGLTLLEERSRLVASGSSLWWPNVNRREGVTDGLG